MRRKAIYLRTLAIAFINAITGPVLTSWKNEGFSSLNVGFGVGYAVLIIGFWSLWTLFRATDDKHASSADHAICFTAMLVLLIPSAMLAWLVLSGVAIGGLIHSQKASTLITPLVIMLAVGMRVPMTSLLLGTVSSEVLSLDAVFVSAGLKLIGYAPELIGNVIIGPNGHSLVIMTGCSSFTNVSMALLVWFAITQNHTQEMTFKTTIAGLGLVAMIVFLNVVRLVLMGISPDLYSLIHDGWGKSVFECSLIVATLGISISGLGGNHARKSIHFSGH